MQTTSFNIPSLSCSSCSSKIVEGIKTLKGIGNVSTDLKSQMINVDYNPSEVQPQDIKKQIYDMGFEVFM